MRTGEPAHGLLWVAAGASLWGTDTVLRQPLTRQLSSFQIVLGEHLVLAAILIPWLWRSRAEWRALKAGQWGAILGIAWGSSALGTLCFTGAIALGNPTTAVLLQKLQPLFAVLLARWLLQEALGNNFGVYLLAAICGAWLVSLGTQLP
jgi:drug/metabolite transporter (DMT)-like permease